MDRVTYQRQVEQAAARAEIARSMALQSQEMMNALRATANDNEAPFRLNLRALPKSATLHLFAALRRARLVEAAGRKYALRAAGGA